MKTRSVLAVAAAALIAVGGFALPLENAKADPTHSGPSVSGLGFGGAMKHGGWHQGGLGDRDRLRDGTGPNADDCPYDGDRARLQDGTGPRHDPDNQSVGGARRGGHR